MTMNLNDNFDLDKVEFTDSELEMPYDNPQRYVGLSGQQVKDVLKDYAPNQDWLKGFYWANVVKYTLRFKDKGGVKDLKKAKDYLEWLIDEETNNEE